SDARRLLSFPTRRSSDLARIEVFGFSPGSYTALLTDHGGISLTYPLTVDASGTGSVMTAGPVHGEGGTLFIPGTPLEAIVDGVSDRKSTRLNSSHVKISY